MGFAESCFIYLLGKQVSQTATTGSQIQQDTDVVQAAEQGVNLCSLLQLKLHSDSTLMIVGNQRMTVYLLKPSHHMPGP